jgi:hypothetical protein
MVGSLCQCNIPRLNVQKRPINQDQP